MNKQKIQDGRPYRLGMEHESMCCIHNRQGDLVCEVHGSTMFILPGVMCPHDLAEWIVNKLNAEQE